MAKGNTLKWVTEQKIGMKIYIAGKKFTENYMWLGTVI